MVNDSGAWRLFAACREGDCGDCIAETLVSMRRDSEPAVDAPMRRELCSCDCHGHDDEAVRS